MKKITKNLIKIPIIVILCISSILASVYSVPILMWLAAPYQLKDEDFYSHEIEFKMVAQFLTEFTNEHPDEEEMLLFIHENSQGFSELNWFAEGNNTDIVIDENIAESLGKIKQLFNENARVAFGWIIVRDAYVYFVGEFEYALAYSPDGSRPPKINPETQKKEYRFKKIEKHWYHRLPKRQLW